MKLLTEYVKKLFAILLLLIYCPLIAQNVNSYQGNLISEKLLLTDNEDSLYIKSHYASFDKNGNYCFVIEDNDWSYFAFPNDTLGAWHGKVRNISGVHGNILYSGSYENEAEPFYYKNRYGTSVYGPSIGKLQCYECSRTNDNMAIITVLHDTAYFYINGRMVYCNHVSKFKKNLRHAEDWVAFSENGNVIYSIQQDSIYRLYVNNDLIDSSLFAFTQLAINDSGAYTYAKGYRPEKPIGKYDYMFYIHNQDTVFDYVRTVWNYDMKPNGAYFYSGDDNGPYYMLINDHLHKDISRVDNIILIDKDTYLYSYKKHNKLFINTNGAIYSCDFNDIFLPMLDTKGHYSYYGYKNSQPYKVVNGKVSKKPIVKSGKNAKPVYISAEGKSLHYFQSNNNAYLYQDNQLLVGIEGRKTVIENRPYTDVLPSKGYVYWWWNTGNGHALSCLRFGDEEYFVYDGTLSHPLLPLNGHTYGDPKIGDVVEGTFNDYGFFAIQKTGDRKFLVIINNKIYQELNNVDKIYERCSFFDGESLIFFGIRDRSVYQFTIRL